jgi:hypothetical protein
MTGQQPGIHRVRPNHREWSPPQVICLDTETVPEQTDAGELHTLRCWAARLDVRRARRPSELGTVTSSGASAAALADQVEEWSEGQRCIWLYAHNLSFDLAVTRLPAVLHDRGWQVTGHAVASDSPWLRMKRGQTVLTFADSWGWLRAPLEHIGADVGYSKPDLPAWDDSDAAWMARAEADVTILAMAMLTLMQWWDEQQLGSWTLTGSAGGWNCWRHKTTCALPLIVPDPEQTAADRAAIYGGRREAFRHGDVPGGPFALLDFRSAYPTIAADKPLPSARQGNFDSLPVTSPLICGPDYGIIAEVTIETGQPRYPVRAGGRVAYPAGRFVTTLAGPEIAEARDRGELVSIGAGYLHRLAPHMAEWARWVLEVTDAERGDVPRVCRRAVKHWGRAVIGKTAARGWRTIPLATLGGSGWDYRPAWNAELQQASHLTDVCGQVAETVPAGDGDNAYPAILAWVESWTRVYLSRAIDQLDRSSVITCDTDGLIVRAGEWQAGSAGNAIFGPLTLRMKGTYQSVTVLGPQHVITPGDTKLAGIPRVHDTAEDGRITALLWPKLATQMSLRPGGTEPGYLRTRQAYTLSGNYVTGYVANNGSVHPLVAEVCSAGRTHLIPWVQPDSGTYPARLQARHLQQMIAPLPAEGQPCLSHTSRSSGTTGASPVLRPTTSSGLLRSLMRRGAAKLRSWLSTGGGSAARAMRA